LSSLTDQVANFQTQIDALTISISAKSNLKAELTDMLAKLDVIITATPIPCTEVDDLRDQINDKLTAVTSEEAGLTAAQNVIDAQQTVTSDAEIALQTIIDDNLPARDFFGV